MSEDATSVDTESIKDAAVATFFDLVDSVRGRKALVIDRQLNGLLSSLVAFSTLQNHGCTELYWFDDEPVLPKETTAIFLIRPTPANAVCLSRHITEQNRRKHKCNRNLFLLPQASPSFSDLLEGHAVLGEVNIYSLPLYFIPLEKDVLSLEIDESFSEVYFEGDDIQVFNAAQALTVLQKQHGDFPYIFGKGSKAGLVSELMIKNAQESAAFDPDRGRSEFRPQSRVFDSLFLFDRAVDFVTPLMTQLTYEGLLTEHFTLKNARLELSSSVLSGLQSSRDELETETNLDAQASSSPSNRKVHLTSNDPLYRELRDANFSVVGKLLNTSARKLNSDYEERHQAKSVSEIKSFVSKLGGLQQEHASLRLHTTLSEQLMSLTADEKFNNMLEIQQNLTAGGDISSQINNTISLIARQVSVSTILRLVCLMSVVSDGLRVKDYDYLRKSIIQAYGFEMLLTLDTLRKASLFTPKVATGSLTTSNVFSRSSFNQIRKPYSLIVDDVNDIDSQDIAYVYSGYAPLSIRLLQCGVQAKAILKSTLSSPSTQESWESCADVLKVVPGETISRFNEQPDPSGRSNASVGDTIAVMFIGGITSTEIAAIRLIARQIKKKLLICTTNVISGKGMMEAALHR